MLVTVIIIGIAAGIMSGLVGIGGGIILVPALVYFMAYTQHQAQGTSLGVLCFPVVILGFLKYYNDLRGGSTPIDFKVVGLLALGFVAGAYFGGSIAIKVNQETLRKFFAVLLFYTAFKLLRWDDVVIAWFKKIA
jgi:uncharacterized protein